MFKLLNNGVIKKYYQNNPNEENSSFDISPYYNEFAFSEESCITTDDSDE